jgi:MazG family protein
MEHLERCSETDYSLGRSLGLVRLLRDRCPWDAKQTPVSLLPYLLEEAHEVADAVRSGDESGLPGELGDLLLNLAFQIVLAEERAAFGAEAVVQALEKKMRDRHPHVYGDAQAAPDWESLKAQERADTPVDNDPFGGVSTGLEPLSRAARIQDRAAGRGFDWPDASGAFAKLREELNELEPFVTQGNELSDEERARLEEEAGDVLFSAINVCRLSGVHPMTALEGATDKFADRFRKLLSMAEEAGISVDDSSLEELDRLWDMVKQTG